MARNKKARRTAPPAPLASLDVVPSEPPPEPEPPLDLPPLFEDLPDDVPGLDELPDLRQEVDHGPTGLGELTGDIGRLSDEDLAAESSPERQDLLHDEMEFDPAPIEASPPSWESASDSTPTVGELPKTDDAIASLLAENARLTDALSLSEHIIDDSHVETARLRTELIEAQTENLRLSEQLVADSAALGTTIEGQLDQIEARDSDIILLQRERESLNAQLATETAQVTNVMQQLESMTEAKISVENRLVDSELTRADLESQLDMLQLQIAEMAATRVDRKLWHIMIDVPIGAPVPRLYIIAGSVTDAIERAVAAQVATHETITNVVEIKGVQLVI